MNKINLFAYYWHILNDTYNEGLFLGIIDASEMIQIVFKLLHHYSELQTAPSLSPASGGVQQSVHKSLAICEGKCETTSQ